MRFWEFKFLKETICKKETVLFFLTGIINTFFGYLIYSILIYFGVAYSVSLLVSTVLGVVFNYFTFGSVVFKQNVKLKVFLKFIISYSFVYFVNVLLLSFLVDILFLTPYLSQLFCMAPVVLINWCLLKFWVFV